MEYNISLELVRLKKLSLCVKWGNIFLSDWAVSSLNAQLGTNHTMYWITNNGPKGSAKSRFCTKGISVLGLGLGTVDDTDFKL